MPNPAKNQKETHPNAANFGFGMTFLLRAIHGIASKRTGRHSGYGECLTLFSLEAEGPKKKALQKRKAVFVGFRSPRLRELFEKSSTKNLFCAVPSCLTKNILAGAEILREFLQKRGKCDILNPNGREGSL